MNMPLLAATIGLPGWSWRWPACCRSPRTAPTTAATAGLTVLIPRHVPTPRFRPRTWSFLGIAAVLGLVFVGLAADLDPAVYAGAVRAVAVAITRNPATVNGYTARLRPATMFLAVAYIVGIAAVRRAGLARRLVHAGACAPLRSAVAARARAHDRRRASRPGLAGLLFGIEATLINLFVGGVVVTRLTLTRFVLPRARPCRGAPSWPWGSVPAGCALIAAVALIIVGVRVPVQRGQPHRRGSYSCPFMR